MQSFAIRFVTHLSISGVNSGKNLGAFFSFSENITWDNDTLKSSLHHSTNINAACQNKKGLIYIGLRKASGPQTSAKSPSTSNFTLLANPFTYSHPTFTLHFPPASSGSPLALALTSNLKLVNVAI